MMEDISFSSDGIKLYYNEEKIDGLPDRSEIYPFNDDLSIQIAENESIHFLPISVEDSNSYKYRSQYYVLTMYGIIKDGRKVQVNITDISVFFDVLVPLEYENKIYEFDSKLYFLIDSSDENNIKEIKEIKAYPMKGYYENPRIYRRIYFHNLQKRKKALSTIKEIKEEKFITASDDIGNYYRTVSSFFDISFTDWAEISNYECTEQDSICSYVFNITLNNFKILNDTPKTFKQPLVMAWDIETYSGRGNGDLPCPEFDNDNAFMVCMSFYELNSTKPLISICLVDVETSPHNEWITIVCGSYINILKAFAICFNAFSPDISIGFNDSNYDWRFIVIKAYKLDILDWMVLKMSVNTRKKSTNEEVYKWNFVEKRQIKISAEENFFSSYLKLSGCISIDVRVCFKKLYPKGESSSLKFYLSKCNLLSKTDMPIKKMWNIYKNSLDGKGDPDQMRLVAHYCIVDAMRCQELMRKRNIIEDLKETGSLTFLTLSDCYYCAGGLKVRQVLKKYASQNNILTTSLVDAREGNGKYPGAFVFTPVKGIIPDPYEVKKIDEIRESYSKEIDSKEIDIKNQTKGMDGNRPVTGLDFGSLYPSIIMTHNLSPEKIITDYKYVQELKCRGINLHPINFIFNDKPITAYSVMHNNNKNNYGLYVKVLIDLAYKRSELKKELSYHGKHKEIIELIFSKNKFDIRGSMNILLEDAKNEIKNYEDSLNNSEIIKIPPGSNLEIEINNMRQIAEEAKYTIKTINSLDEKTIKEEYERVCFDWFCINTKQNALKIVMNTFYGEAGNALSPYFLLALAGGVTSEGQYNIKLIADFVIKKGYIIKYGDTDSLYLVPPNSYFENCDREYITGTITKEEWMAAMIRITMRSINHLKNEVNEYLEKDNGTKFLKMNYEEVLFPVVFTGKKKYFGIPHTVHILFTNHLFIRGIDVIKQGQSELAKKIGYQIMHESVCIHNKYSILEIVKNSLKNAVNNPDKWEFKDFIKSDAYKPNKDNKSVQRFVSRMRAVLAIAKKENEQLQKEGLEMKPYPFAIPEPGERFNYVIASKCGDFDMNGRKIAIKKGDRMEFVDFALKEKMQIDILFYITNYVIGICTRFISSDQMFQPTDSNLTDNQIDEYSQKQAKKMLENFVKQLINTDTTPLKKKGYAYRRAYNNASSKMKKILQEQIGNVVNILHGKEINYSLFTDYDESSNKEQSEIVWNKLLSISDELVNKPINTLYFEKVCKILKISKNGDDIYENKVEKTSHNLYKYEATRKSNISKLLLNKLDIKEASIRNQIIQLIPQLYEISMRYEINLYNSVNIHRKEQHDLYPEIGDNSIEVKDIVALYFDESDKSILNLFYKLWNLYNNVKIVKYGKIQFYIYLNILKNKRI